MGIGPGNIASQIPPRADDGQRKQRDLARAQREQASARTAAATQIGSGGLLVNGGGSITIDAGGSLNVLGSGSINVPSGGLNSAGSITAATTITAGGNITSSGGGLFGGFLSVSGTIGGASLSCSGNISSTAGTVFSQNAFQSPGSRATIVTSGFVNAYLDVNGVLGYQPSTRKLKKNLRPIPQRLLDATLRLPTYLGRYKTETADAPLTPFLIAEDVREAGFGPSVVPSDANGDPAAINHQNLVPVLVELIKRQEARIAALEAKVSQRN